jgi:RHH-type rel operon transcriptional repressor/antitoxin RelB
MRVSNWRLAMATSVELDPPTEQRLDLLAAQTGRTKAAYLREIIALGLQDLEDCYRASPTGIPGPLDC